jgi:hypothetical protein
MSRLTHPPPFQADNRPKRVESEKAQQTLESKEPSLATSPSAQGVENPENTESDGPATEVVEYPKGFEMFFIMLSLVLSITLCSLDQVSSAALSLSQSCLSPTSHMPVC